MVQIVAELFRVPRPLVMHANDRNYQSNRGSTLPLRSIPGREGDIDVKRIAGHGDGPFSARRYVQHSDALDRLGPTCAGLRTLIEQNLKPGCPAAHIALADTRISKPYLFAGGPCAMAISGRR
jgi:hypothetical protein